MTRRTRIQSISAAALVGFLLAGPCLAQSGSTTTSGTVPAPVTTGGVATQVTPLMRIQRSVAKINAQASTPEGEAEVVKQLSSRLKVSPDTLEANRVKWGLGWGETAMVYTFAKSSKKPITPDGVVEMRRSGTEWDVIAKDLGINIQAVAKKMNKNVPPSTKPAAK